MKKIAILILVALIPVFSIKAIDGQKSKIKLLAKTGTITFSADSVSVCKNKPTCLSSIIREIAKTPDNYILVYQKTDLSWYVQAEAKEIVKDILSLKSIKNITIGTGNVRVLGKEYSQKKMALFN